MGVAQGDARRYALRVSTPAIPSRAQRLLGLADRHFDLLVIGGGITGAGIARDAARRGLAVGLVEKDDFASGTSSRSSRLIHGGVRYLEHGYLHLVFEASRERRRLLALAPHLVRPLQFTWPVYRGARVPRWKLFAGLALYDTLALFRNVGRHRRLDSTEVLEAEPHLAGTDLRGGATYWDAATEDARLTLANVLDAAHSSATVLNYVELKGLTFANGAGAAVTGAIVRDRRGGSEFPVQARLVVNACGPWTDEVARMEDPSARATVRGTKGVHISVPAARVGNVGAVTMLSPDDGRVLFTLPSGTHTIIGTTDTRTSEHPHEVRAARGDVRYLLSACNRFFPDARLTEDDVVAAWAGIRPLVARRKGADPASASREHHIRASACNVLTITGGKLTTYREMAEQCVDVALRQLGTRVRPCDTASAPLPGQRPAAAATDVRLVNELPWRDADMEHAVRAELAETIGDLLIRRTTLAFEQRDHGLALAAQVGARMGALLQWTDAGIALAVADYAAEVRRTFAITADAAR